MEERETYGTKKRSLLKSRKGQQETGGKQASRRWPLQPHRSLALLERTDMHDSGYHECHSQCIQKTGSKLHRMAFSLSV